MGNPRFDTGLVRTAKAAVVRRGLQNVFASRLERAKNKVQRIIVISPWITGAETGNSPLRRICSIVRTGNIVTYVFTRPPGSIKEINALNVLKECPSVEIVFNTNLHAKLYVCDAPYPFGFAILGSANFTLGSEELHEIGLIVLSAGGGEEILRQFSAFGLDYLRTRPESNVVKRISYRR